MKIVLRKKGVKRMPVRALSNNAMEAKLRAEISEWRQKRALTIIETMHAMRNN